ncbi:hypothetical protein PV08_07499 [Exophiala spinifera]|uniref:DUF7587 domain-containing protein n=1 Tax=Exophiala spinifera TaxID=91928 RepID=A0A0D2B7Q5_9EURO|nr:uncharacterized protein PV08_07499 [Exophiala spinifera]KIW14715.1 hypothetical protein PV08_07499 [Exophiala spinifera]
MERYACLNIPHELYRIDYPGSQTTFTSEKGFKATDTERTFGADDLHDFKQALESQFKWSCRDPVPFISLFSDQEHAENWGRKEPWRGNRGPDGSWALYVINAIELKETTPIFKLSSLVQMLKLVIPDGAQQHIQGAYLCLHRVPQAAIINKRTPGEIETGKCLGAGDTTCVSLIADRESRRARRLEEPDRYDYLGDCGDSDSDREMLQENYNSIFDRNIEDAWFSRD